MSDTRLRRIGLIGDPVAHSRSPAMQNAAFAHLGIAARYERWHTPAAQLPARVASLRAPDILGANITLPHKTAVLDLLDMVEPEAALIGAVNTIYKQADGSLTGANTDAPALLDALREESAFVPAGQRVVLLGASGAARAAAFALVEAGVQQLVVANRTPERAEALLSDIIASRFVEEEQTRHEPGGNGQQPPLPDVSFAGIESQLVALALDDPDLTDYITESALLINATSLGWHSDETPLPEPPVGPDTLVYDMVYRPTRLLYDAAARGARTLDGLGMLVRQGALAFTRWTGREAPLDVMHRALQET